MESHSKDFEAIKEHIDSWKDFSESDVEFEKLAGLSNVVWRVSANDEKVQPNAVIYRVFGNKGGEFVDRTSENYIFDELSKVKLGPKCYGYTSKYRIEECCKGEEIPDHKTRDPEIRRKIAMYLARLHSLKLPKLSEKPAFLQNLEDGVYSKEIEKKLSNTKFEDHEIEKIKEIEKKLFDKEEVDFLYSILPENPESIKFSHNDLHGGNILLHKPDDQYLFIDFEYSGYNYRAFDIANLFIEAMLDYDHEKHPWYKIVKKNYPNQSELEEFVKYYTFFTMIGKDLTEEENSKVLSDPKSLSHHIEKCGKAEEFDKTVKQILKECEIGNLLSHYHWTLWSITFSKQKEKKFDYISYAHDRFKLYQEEKADFISQNDNKDK